MPSNDVRDEKIDQTLMPKIAPILAEIATRVEREVQRGNILNTQNAIAAALLARLTDAMIRAYETGFDQTAAASPLDTDAVIAIRPKYAELRDMLAPLAGQQIAKAVDGIQNKIYDAPIEERELKSAVESDLTSVATTALLAAYIIGQVSASERTDAHSYEYVAVLDNRTRDSHAAMNGTIAPIHSSIWEIWTPPNGFNCRCTLKTHWDEVLPRYTGSGAIPDPGFA